MTRKFSRFQEHSIGHIARQIALWCVLAIGLGAAAGANAQSGMPVFSASTAWHPSGQYVAVSGGSMLTIYEALTGNIANTFPLAGSQLYMPNPVTWSPDGEYLAYADDRDIYIWSHAWDTDQSHEHLLYKYYEAINRPQVRAPVEDVGWSPDNQRIAVFIGDNIQIVDATNGTLLSRILAPSRITSFVWAADNRILVTTGDGSVIPYDPLSGQPLSFLEIAFDTGRPLFGVYGLALDPTGQQAVFGTSKGEIFRWLNTHSPVPNAGEVDVWAQPSDYINGITVQEWSPTGQFVATGTTNGDIVIREAANGTVVDTISVGTGVYVNGLAWSPDGSQLAYGLPDDGGYAILDASTLPGYVPMATAAREHEN